MISLPWQVNKVLFDLEKHGYKAYLVGGSVRDFFLNKHPHDFDIATNAPLERVIETFPGSKIIGAAFGVALVTIDGLDIQVARFRTDGQYSDHRHPDEVQFVDDVMEDLNRRDFTINAIAWNHKELVHVEDAMLDLKEKLINAVGDPWERFNEDPLRMLRAIRFASQLGFRITNTTLMAIANSAELIKTISAERIKEEFNKILLSPDTMSSFKTMYLLGLSNYIIPELDECFHCQQGKWHKHDVWMHILLAIKYAPDDDLILHLTAILHDIGKPKCQSVDEQNHIHFYGHDEVSSNMAREILTRLKYDNETIDEVTYLVRWHMELMMPPTTDKGIRKLLNRHGEVRLKRLITFRRMDLLASGTRDEYDVAMEIGRLYQMVDRVLQEKPPVTFDDLAINGNDIMKILNLRPCKEVGKVKQYLMETVLNDPGMNTKEQLEELLKRLYGEERMI